MQNLFKYDNRKYSLIDFQNIVSNLAQHVNKSSRGEDFDVVDVSFSRSTYSAYIIIYNKKTTFMKSIRISQHVPIKTSKLYVHTPSYRDVQSLERAFMDVVLKSEEKRDGVYMDDRTAHHLNVAVEHLQNIPKGHAYLYRANDNRVFDYEQVGYHEYQKGHDVTNQHPELTYIFVSVFNNGLIPLFTAIHAQPKLYSPSIAVAVKINTFMQSK